MWMGAPPVGATPITCKACCLVPDCEGRGHQPRWSSGLWGVHAVSPCTWKRAQDHVQQPGQEQRRSVPAHALNIKLTEVACNVLGFFLGVFCCLFHFLSRLLFFFIRQNRCSGDPALSKHRRGFHQPRGGQQDFTKVADVCLSVYIADWL